MMRTRKLPPVLSVWANRNFAIFMAGCIPNYITFWMQKVGIGWLAWELTHSPFWLGVVTAVDLMPLLVLAPFAGALADRWEALKQFRVTQICVLLHGVALPVLYFTGLMRIEVLIALSVYSGIIYPFNSTARLAILPRLLPRAEFATGIGLDSAFFHGSRFIGPAIAAVIIPVFGVGATFLVNAIGSANMLTALWFVELRPSEGEPRKAKNIFADVGEAFSYIRNQGGIATIFMMLTVASAFTRPIQDMMPALAGDVFHSGAVGLAWLTSSLGIGAMISAAWIASRGRISGLTMVIISGAFNVSIGVAGLVATDQLWIGIVCAVLTGFSLNTMSTSVQTLVQSSVSDDMRGRVMSLYIMIFRGAPAFGSLLIGIASSHFGLRITFAVAACMSLITGLIAFPRRRRLAAELEKDAHVR